MFRIAAALACACLALIAVPAAASPVCDPGKGQWFTVSGVAANDTLNLRAGPGTKYGIVGRLAPGQGGIRATGEVGFSNSDCKDACRLSNAGVEGFDGLIAKICLPKGSIWYKVTGPAKKTGWASARFLRVAKGPEVAVPPIAPLPDAGATYRFTCDNGQRLRLTTRPATDDARLIDKAGTITYLSRDRDSRQPIAYLSRIHNSKMAIRGTRQEAVYTNFRGDRTRCYELP